MKKLWKRWKKQQRLNEECWREWFRWNYLHRYVVRKYVFKNGYISRVVSPRVRPDEPRVITYDRKHQKP